MEPTDEVLEAACLVTKLEELGYQKVKLSSPEWVDVDFKAVIDELKVAGTATFACYRGETRDPSLKQMPSITVIVASTSPVIRYTSANCDEARQDLDTALSTYLN